MASRVALTELCTKLWNTQIKAIFIRRDRSPKSNYGLKTYAFQFFSGSDNWLRVLFSSDLLTCFLVFFFLQWVLHFCLCALLFVYGYANRDVFQSSTSYWLLPVWLMPTVSEVSCLLLPFVESSKWSHSPGTSGLRNAKRCTPPFVKWMYVRAHIRKTSCCHDAKEKAMRRWFLFFIFAKEVVFTLAVGWWGFDQPSSTRTLHALADMGHATALATFARAPGAACSRIMTAGNRNRSPFAVHGCSNLHRFAFDFFDSHFFALWFAVVSQCPEIDSQNCDAKLDKLLPNITAKYAFCAAREKWFSTGL